MIYKYYIRCAESESSGNLAILSYDSDCEKYVVDIFHDVDESALPAILYFWVKKGVYHLEGKEAKRFVKARVIPPDRQNIGTIMRKVGMKYYDEFPLLVYTSGRCCQDECYIKEIK